MGQILGSRQTQRGQQISSHDRAVLQLKQQRDKLKQYQRQLQTVIEREVEIARQHLQRGDKKRAGLVLKKKQYQQQLMDKTEGQLMNLEELTQSLEFAMVEKQVMDGLRDGTRVLQLLNQEMRLENVEKLMGDTADAIAYQQEVEKNLGELSGGVGDLTAEEESRLFKELEEMEQMALEQEQLSMPRVPLHGPATEEPGLTIIRSETALGKAKQRANNAKQEA